jgi:hypothetical protein
VGRRMHRSPIRSRRYDGQRKYSCSYRLRIIYLFPLFVTNLEFLRRILRQCVNIHAPEYGNPGTPAPAGRGQIIVAFPFPLKSNRKHERVLPTGDFDC